MFLFMPENIYTVSEANTDPAEPKYAFPLQTV